MRLSRVDEREEDGVTITEFLLARIAEDEAAATACIQREYGATGEWMTFDDTEWLSPHVVFARQGGGGNGLGQVCNTEASWIGRPARDYIASHAPARGLAECEAKRRIVERCGDIGLGFPARHLAEGVLSLLALPYARHPDYDEAWRV